MPRQQSRKQKEIVKRVMHEYKRGELDSSRGGEVKSRRQAVAIALNEAGASKYQSKAKNARNLKRTERRERQGKTTPATIESRTRAELYAEARRRDIPGRSSMNKAELARALRR
jgi:hypothetical protein